MEGVLGISSDPDATVGEGVTVGVGMFEKSVDDEATPGMLLPEAGVTAEATLVLTGRRFA